VGIDSEGILTDTEGDVFTSAYLSRIDIIAPGVQQKLLRIHHELTGENITTLPSLIVPTKELPFAIREPSSTQGCGCCIA